MNDPLIAPPPQEDDSFSEKEILIFLLIFASIVISLDILSLKATFENILYYGSIYGNYTFNTCYKSHLILEILFTLVSAAGATSALIVLIYYSIVHIIPQGLKFFDCITYINYFIFGPMLLASGIYGLYKFDKVCYYCENGWNPYNRTFDYSMAICLTISITIGLLVSLLYLSIQGHEIVKDSVKFSYSGNSILGNFFWKLAFFVGAVNLSNNNNNNNGNNNGNNNDNNEN